MIISYLMWLERLIVVQEVVGSRPIFHPTENLAAMRGFFMPENQWLCSSIERPMPWA